MVMAGPIEAPLCSHGGKMAKVPVFAFIAHIIMTGLKKLVGTMSPYLGWYKLRAIRKNDGSFLSWSTGDTKDCLLARPVHQWCTGRGSHNRPERQVLIHWHIDLSWWQRPKLCLPHSSLVYHSSHYAPSTTVHLDKSPAPETDSKIDLELVYRMQFRRMDKRIRTAVQSWLRHSNS